MYLNQETMTVIPGASTAVTLDYPVDMIVSAEQDNITNGHTPLTVVSTTAAAGDLEFTGTPGNPVSTATLGTAAVATDSVILQVVRSGAAPASI